MMPGRRSNERQGREWRMEGGGGPSSTPAVSSSDPGLDSRPSCFLPHQEPASQASQMKKKQAASGRVDSSLRLLEARISREDLVSNCRAPEQLLVRETHETRPNQIPGTRQEERSVRLPTKGPPSLTDISSGLQVGPRPPLNKNGCPGPNQTVVTYYVQRNDRSSPYDHANELRFVEGA